MLDRFLNNRKPSFRSPELSMDAHYNPPGIRGDWKVVADDWLKINAPAEVQELENNDE